MVVITYLAFTISLLLYLSWRKVERGRESEGERKREMLRVRRRKDRDNAESDERESKETVL